MEEKPGLKSCDTAYGESTSPPKGGKRRNVPCRKASVPARAVARRLRLSSEQGGTAPTHHRPRRGEEAPSAGAAGPRRLGFRDRAAARPPDPGLPGAPAAAPRRAGASQRCGRALAPGYPAPRSGWVGSAGFSWKLRQSFGFLPPRRSVRRIPPHSLLGRSRHGLPAPRRQHGADRLIFPFFHKQVSTPQETAYAANRHTSLRHRRSSHMHCNGAEALPFPTGLCQGLLRQTEEWSSS